MSMAFGAGTHPKKSRLKPDPMTMTVTQKKGGVVRTVIGNLSRAKMRTGFSTSSSLARSHRRDETFGSSRAKSVLLRVPARSITVRRWTKQDRDGGNEMEMGLTRTKRIHNF